MLPPIPLLTASLWFLTTISCAPTPTFTINHNTNNNKPVRKASSQPEYDFSKYREVYDQRQNGSENVRVNLDGVVVIWTPPGGLLQAATLLDAGLFDTDYNEPEDFWVSEHDKPQESVVTSEESTGLLVATSSEKPLETGNSSEAPANSELLVIAGQHSTVTETSGSSSTSEQPPKISRRKFRIPGFIRPFMRKHPAQ